MPAAAAACVLHPDRRRRRSLAPTPTSSQRVKSTRADTRIKMPIANRSVCRPSRLLKTASRSFWLPASDRPLQGEFVGPRRIIGRLLLGGVAVGQSHQPAARRAVEFQIAGRRRSWSAKAGSASPPATTATARPPCADRLAGRSKTSRPPSTRIWRRRATPGFRNFRRCAGIGRLRVFPFFQRRRLDPLEHALHLLDGARRKRFLGQHQRRQ